MFPFFSPTIHTGIISRFKMHLFYNLCVFKLLTIDAICHMFIQVEHRYDVHHVHRATFVFQAACIPQQSSTLAATHGTPIQLEDLTEDSGGLQTLVPGTKHKGQQHCQNTHNQTSTYIKIKPLLLKMTRPPFEENDKPFWLVVMRKA